MLDMKTKVHTLCAMHKTQSPCFTAAARTTLFPEGFLHLESGIPHSSGFSPVKGLLLFSFLGWLLLTFMTTLESSTAQAPGLFSAYTYFPDDSQIYIISSDLSHKLQSQVSNVLVMLCLNNAT